MNPVGIPSPPEHGCPLCAAQETSFFDRDARRDYFRCAVCRLVFVAPDALPSVAEEKSCYDHHQNDPADARYRRFLSRISDPLLSRLPPQAHGLDFGCGPGPTLSLMLAEAGYSVDEYDPIYRPDERIWAKKYDFITASEVFEHLHRPGTDLPRVWDLLQPGGWLAVMTKRVQDAEAFSTWHYKNDPTHVVFFSRASFIWLARQWSALLEVVGPDVVLLQKPR